MKRLILASAIALSACAPGDTDGSAEHAHLKVRGATTEKPEECLKLETKFHKACVVVHTAFRVALGRVASKEDQDGFTPRVFSRELGYFNLLRKLIGSREFGRRYRRLDNKQFAGCIHAWFHPYTHRYRVDLDKVASDLSRGRITRADLAYDRAKATEEDRHRARRDFAPLVPRRCPGATFDD